MNIKVEIKEEPQWLEDEYGSGSAYLSTTLREHLQKEFKKENEEQEVEVDIASLKDHITVEELHSLPLESNYRLPAEILSSQNTFSSTVFDSLAEKCILEENARTLDREERKTCEVCGKIFRQTSLFKKHVLHHEIKEFHQCELCGKSFSVMSGLKRHYIAHKRKAPYKCGVCSKSFIYAHNLRIHNMVHEHKNNTSCAVCRKRFLFTSNLRKHSLMHGH